MRERPDRSMSRGVALVLTLLAIFPAAAWAEAYLGAALGGTRFSSYSTCTGSSSCDLDKYGFGAKIYGGYRFTDYFAVEGGWTDLGETSAAVTGSVVAGDRTAVDWRAQGVEASVLLTIPFGDDVRFYTRLGAIDSKTDADVSYTNLGVTTVTARSVNEINFTLGFGGQWDIGDYLALRFEWQRYLDVGEDSTTGSADVDLFAISALFRF